MICYSLTFFPINLEVFSFFNMDVFLPDKAEEVPEVVAPIYSFDSTTDFSTRLINPKAINFNLMVNTTAKNDLVDLAFNIDFYQSDKLVKGFVGRNIVLKETPKADAISNKIVMDIDLRNITLELPNGFYEVIITGVSDAINEIEPITFQAAYISTDDYVGSSNTIPEDKLYTKLFYPDNTNSFIIPITREHEKNDNGIRPTANKLMMPTSQSSGFGPLFGSPRISTISNYGYRKYSLLLKTSIWKDFVANEELTEIAIEAYMQTLLALERITEVNFIFTDDRKLEAIGDLIVKEPYVEDISNKAYKAYVTKTDKIFLAPFPIPSNLTLESEQIKNIVSQIKESPDGMMLPLLAPEVELNGVTVTNGVASLNFNKAFLNVFPEHLALQNLLLDSLVFSCTSIDGIDMIQLQVDGKTIESFGGLETMVPLGPNLYINVEPK